MRAQGAGYRLALDSSVRWRTQCRFAEIAQPANSYVLALGEVDGSGDRRLVWRTLEDGKSMDFQQEPATTVWERLQVDMLSLLPLDELLKMATCPLRAEGGTGPPPTFTVRRKADIGPALIELETQKPFGEIRTAILSRNPMIRPRRHPPTIAP